MTLWKVVTAFNLISHLNGSTIIYFYSLQKKIPSLDVSFIKIQMSVKVTKIECILLMRNYLIRVSTIVSNISSTIFKNFENHCISNFINHAFFYERHLTPLLHFKISIFHHLCTIFNNEYGF